jgi:pyruvate dehydrogenase E2 component (dihydrolipoyllysine-residue acetyltransferase)
VPRVARLALTTVALAAPLALLTAGVASADVEYVPVAPCGHAVVHPVVVEPVVVAPVVAAPVVVAPLIAAPVIVG